MNRKVADEDVTVFGEQVAELHVDTLATGLDPAMRDDYQAGAGLLRAGELKLGEATSVADVAARDQSARGRAVLPGLRARSP